MRDFQRNQPTIEEAQKDAKERLLLGFLLELYVKLGVWAVGVERVQEWKDEDVG